MEYKECAKEHDNTQNENENVDLARAIVHKHFVVVVVVFFDLLPLSPFLQVIRTLAKAL